MRKLLLPLFVVLAAAAHADDLKKVVADHEAGFKKAILTKDVKWFDMMAAPDYHEVDTKGKKSDRATVMAMMKQMFQASSVKTITVKVNKITPTKTGVVVLTDCHMVGTMVVDPKAKKSSTIDSTQSYQETWVKKGAKWQIVELKTLKDKTLLDGKPFSM